MIKKIYIIIICGLFCACPEVALGQTSAFQSEGWWPFCKKGGIIRTKTDSIRAGRHYLMTEGGAVSSLVNTNYVDGYSFGPDLTLGWVDARGGRWEGDVYAQYALARKVMMGEGALRYIFAPEWHAEVEVYGARRSSDFDSDPMQNASMRSLMCGLFGWNSAKLYDSQLYGARGSFPLGAWLQLDLDLSWEERKELRNHKKRNLFRMKGESNAVPLRGGVLLRDWEIDEGGWGAEAALTLMPGRKIYVYDDLHSEAVSDYPTLTLDVKSDASSYTSLRLDVEQELGSAESHWHYFVSAGDFVQRDGVFFADWHHLDASHAVWQTQKSLTWFSLLTNYELSTDRSWAEAHVEWSTNQYLLSALTDGSWLREYVQLHAATVYGHRLHTEASYGIDLVDKIRLGVSVGWDGKQLDGCALNLVFAPN